MERGHQIMTAVPDAPPITCVNAMTRNSGLRGRPTYIPRPTCGTSGGGWSFHVVEERCSEPGDQEVRSE